MRPRNARIDPALDRYIPPDTTVMAGINLARLRDTALYQQHSAQLTDRALEDFTRQTGVDPRSDLDQAAACSDGNRMLVLARGRFGNARERLRSSGALRTTWHGVDIFGAGEQAAAFPDSATALAGPVELVRRAIDQKSGGVPEALRPVVDAIPASDQIWFATAGGLPGLHGEVQGNMANLVRLAQSVQTASAGIDVSNGLSLDARADCVSEEDARKVHDALRGIIAFARLAAPANRQNLVKAYDAINVVREKAEVRVSAALNQQDTHALLSLWSSR